MQHLLTQREIEKLLQRPDTLVGVLHKRIAEHVLENGFDSHVKKMVALPVGYRTVFVASCVSAEIDNGGFYQYFGNSTAEDYHNLAIVAFKTIGANEIARLFENVFETICKQSVSFRTSHLVDGMQTAFNHANDCLEEIHIEEYDDIFYELDSGRENVEALLIKYVQENINDF